MDSGNSGSISSSGDEEYDSRADHTLLPSTFLNHHPNIQFGSTSISHPAQQSSLVSSHHHSLFDLSSTYLHSLSQSQPNSSNPNSFLNLDTAAATSQGRRSEPDCTDPANLPGVSLSSSSPPSAMNQCLFPPHGLGHCATDPSLQLRSIHDDNNARVLSITPTTTNAARNSKKRTRASRRAPTTVLTTDTSNFRAMVQEFTGIPAPPFSGSSSFSRTRRLDLLTGSSSSPFRSSSSHFDATSSFYPLRPSPQKLHHHHQNPFVLSSSSSPSPSTLHNNNNNMVDAAIASSTTNISSSATTNNNSINYQLPSDLGLPYHHQHNIMLSMQNHPALAFHPAPPPLHPLGNHVLAGFGAKSPSLEELGMSHGQVNNADLGAGGGVSMHQGHGQQVTSLEWGYGSKVVASGDGGGSCKMNFASSASASNHEKNIENNGTSTRGEGTTVDSWICSSD